MSVNVIPRLRLKVTFSLTCNVPPFKTILLEVIDSGTAPKFLSALIFSVPALMTVPPVYVLVLDKVNVPDPVLVRDPVPEITPAIEEATLELIVRLDISPTLPVIVTAPAPEPVEMVKLCSAFEDPL